jgi:transcriptional pleiotropic regulator of transition state genes
MKNTGIIRRLDELGRITIPMELRKTFNIGEREPLEISVEDDKIILTKYLDTDIFSGEQENLIEYCGKKVSKDSILEMVKLAGFELKEKTDE